MTTSEKLKLLKVIKIILLIFYTSVILFYLGLVLPQYLACLNCNSGEAMEVDIWGNEVWCFGESKEFVEFFFQFSSIVTGGLTFVLLICCFLIHYLKKVPV
ncbi:hypothetical protein [Flavobacterium soyae]|uniref:Uncharacterized protein n=1 Tax=Flavobacterium soyae TaxID=2903098 RepID=A0ABZ2UD79_9FLAO